MDEKVEESLERDPTNLKENMEARLPNAPESLQCGIVGLKFQFKMREFMDSVIQEFKRGKQKMARQDKIIELLMMQGARPSSSTKKLAKVNMPNIFSRLGKTRNGQRKCVLELDNTMMSKGRSGLQGCHSGYFILMIMRLNGGLASMRKNLSGSQL